MDLVNEKLSSKWNASQYQDIISTNIEKFKKKDAFSSETFKKAAPPSSSTSQNQPLEVLNEEDINWLLSVS